jgi:hypothetical protein
MPDRAQRVALVALEMQHLTRKLVTRGSPWHSRPSRVLQGDRRRTSDWNLVERPRLKGSRRLLHKFAASPTRIARPAYSNSNTAAAAAAAAAAVATGGSGAGAGADQQPLNSTFRRYAEHCRDLPHSTFSVIREGFIGIAYGGAFRVEGPADSVVVLFGASMPLVLREINAQGHTEEFSIVAGAYVSCLMQGELLELYGDRKSFTIA